MVWLGGGEGDNGESLAGWVGGLVVRRCGADEVGGGGGGGGGGGSGWRGGSGRWWIGMVWALIWERLRGFVWGAREWVRGVIGISAVCV